MVTNRSDLNCTKIRMQMSLIWNSMELENPVSKIVELKSPRSLHFISHLPIWMTSIILNKSIFLIYILKFSLKKTLRKCQIYIHL